MTDARVQADSIAGRIHAVRGRIESACLRSGRAASEVTLVGVTKTVPAEIVAEAIAAGLRVLGENRVQEASGKIERLKGLGAEWHFIGHLQSNKARKAVELFDAIHSVDSLRLAERLSGIAAESGKPLPVFLEVNLGGEESKSGVGEPGVLQLCEAIGRLPHLAFRGLMTVPPFLEDPEEIRPFFRKLRQLRDRAVSAGIVDSAFRELSMGMSHDFEVAIEEGSTFVRVGSAIFGPRA